MDTLPLAAALCPPHHWLIKDAGPIQHWACHRCQTTRDVPRGHWSTTSQFNSSRPRPARTGPATTIAMPVG